MLGLFFFGRAVEDTVRRARIHLHLPAPRDYRRAGLAGLRRGQRLSSSLAGAFAVVMGLLHPVLPA